MVFKQTIIVYQGRGQDQGPEGLKRGVYERFNVTFETFKLYESFRLKIK